MCRVEQSCIEAHESVLTVKDAKKNIPRSGSLATDTGSQLVNERQEGLVEPAV